MLPMSSAPQTDVEAGVGVVGAAAAEPAPVTCVSAALSREEFRSVHTNTVIASSSSASAAASAQVTFRMLRRDDLPQVMQLHRDLFPVQYTDAFFDKLFTTGYFCQVGLSDETGEVITVASARVVDYMDPDAIPTNEAYIMTLGVRPSHRRLGLGARQMEQLMKLLRAKTRCTHVALHVKAANLAACAFYDGLGFTCNAYAGDLLPNHYFLYGEFWDACKYSRPLVSGPVATLLRDMYLDGCTIL